MLHFADIVILGGGPASSCAAIAIKKKDPKADVLVVTPDEEPRHRIGEALLTGTIYTLKELGLIESLKKEGFHTKKGAAYVWGKDSKPWYVNYPKDSNSDYPECFTTEEGRLSIHTPSHLFDSFLRKEALKLGVRYIYEKIVDVKHSNNKIFFLNTDKKAKIRGGFYIDASGQSSVIGSRLSERLKLSSNRISRYIYTNELDWETAENNGFDKHRTNIISCKNGWFWVIHLGKKGKDLTSVGFVSNPDVIKDLTFHNIGLYFPELKLFGIKNGIYHPKSHLGDFASRWYSRPDWSYQSKELHGDNWCLCGDSALFVDPILSQGVTLSCHYGMLRGLAALNYLETGSLSYMENVTEHYINEGNVLKYVINEWYNNNKHVGSWKMKSVELAKSIHGKDMTKDEAFRWITNLENMFEEYHPFPKEIQEIINYNLKGNK